MKLRIGITVLSLSVLALVFQNCAKAQFNGVEEGAYFKAEAVPMNSNNGGDDGSLAGTPDISLELPPLEDQDKTPEHQVKTPEHLDKTHESESDSSLDLVECELGSPSLKIKLSLALDAEHSNGQSTRVCMSENACLKLINEYAANHSNSMEKGPETSPGSPAQCTKIFPGSKGTCHNAKALSDEQITGILAEMAK